MLVSEVVRGKALALVLETAVVTDESGRAGGPRGAARGRQPAGGRHRRRRGRRGDRGGRRRAATQADPRPTPARPPSRRGPRASPGPVRRQRTRAESGIAASRRRALLSAGMTSDRTRSRATRRRDKVTRSERADHARPADRRGPDPAARQRHRARRPGLQPPAARAHHLPRLGGRGRQRQRHLRADAAARRRGPRQGHLALHQLPGRLGLGRHGDLRHDAVRQERRRHRGDGSRGLDGPVPALRRRRGQALRHCRTRGS